MPDATDADPPRQDAEDEARRDEVLRRMLTTPRRSSLRHVEEDQALQMQAIADDLPANPAVTGSGMPPPPTDSLPVNKSAFRRGKRSRPQ